MIITIQKHKEKQLEYKVNQNKELFGIANRTFNFLPRKIQILSSSELLWTMQQRNFFKCFLRWFSFLRPFITSPYQISYKSTACGSSKRVRSIGYEFRVGDDLFELCPHKSNKFSLTKNHHQIALFEKDLFFLAYNNHYLINCVNSADISFLLCMCIFIDVTYFTDERIFSNRKKVIHITGKDSFPERSNWNPDFEENVNT